MKWFNLELYWVLLTLIMLHSPKNYSTTKRDSVDKKRDIWTSCTVYWIKFTCDVIYGTILHPNSVSHMLLLTSGQGSMACAPSSLAVCTTWVLHYMGITLRCCHTPSTFNYCSWCGQVKSTQIQYIDIETLFTLFQKYPAHYSTQYSIAETNQTNITLRTGDRRQRPIMICVVICLSVCLLYMHNVKFCVPLVIH